MRPELSFSPDWKRRGVRPKWAPTVRELLKRAGTSTAALKLSAVISPTPGILRNPRLWPHLANRDAIAQFWVLRPADREALWGPKISIREPLATFEPDYINDGQLGLI